jgi:hypothetical protein
MADTKFTPGPWRTALADDTLIIDSEGNQVAETLGDYESDYRRMEANAQLIAAALDMYEALGDALLAIDNMAAILTAHGLTGTLTDPTPAIRAVLTKARGGK